jgi:UDP-N-acetyl-2-amino-2-deoxyglucuronate dehydrogenase
VRFALRVGADAVCEKPLVINPWNLDGLETMQEQSGRRIHTILQLRLHPSIIALRDQVQREGFRKRYSIDLTYVTSRGKWYLYSWKGDAEKSGGLATNIGIHFFDLLTWIFGAPTSSVVHLSTPTKIAGLLELKHADVRWFLSIDRRDLPQPPPEGPAMFRSLKMDGQEIEFSDSFGDLHTLSYRQILAGNGFSIGDARPSINLAHEIRNAAPIGLKGEYHSFAQHV